MDPNPDAHNDNKEGRDLNVGRKRVCGEDPTNRRPCKEAKEKDFASVLGAWTESLKAKTKASMSRGNRYRQNFEVLNKSQEVC